MTDQYPDRLLPALQQLPPCRPSSCRQARAEQWHYWMERQNALRLELEAVEADQFHGPLSPGEREQIRGVYLAAMARCQQKMDKCLI